MNKRTLTLVVAAILALGAGLLTFDYLASVSRSAHVSPPRAVLVAVQEIPARELLSPGMVRVVQRPANAVDPNALSTPDGVKGDIALITIPAGSTITSSNIGRPQELALPVRLRPGMRAVSIPVDMVKDVSGLIQAGDRVDVIAVPPRGAERQPKAYAILRDIEVVAVGDHLEQATTAPKTDTDPRTVTLEVTPKQADLLAMADLNTTLRLALRSPQERAHPLPPEHLVFAPQYAANPSMPQPASAPQPAAPARPAAAPPLSPVTVIDGSEIVSGAAHK
ncbi:MAG TPA: Flp pilus assembly protein CpaB [Candidatus Dormibacteraeota bacterium]|nr:Flp pilus assembly protein CpaB [Candidatus Dormibacteraeota bacterium]